MLSDFGAKEWILSNGAKVILKKTDFKSDEISMMRLPKAVCLLVVMIRLLICFLCRLYWNNMVWVTY